MKRFTRIAVYVLAVVGLLWVPSARAVVFWNFEDLSIGGWPGPIAVADFNGDGHADLALTTTAGALTVQLGNGSGGFTQAGTGIALGTDNPAQIVATDVNGDGHPDLVVVGSDRIVTLLGDGNGGFSSNDVPLTAGSGLALAVGDFNGDGHTDVAALDSTGEVEVFLGDGLGGFTWTSSFSVNNTTTSQPEGALVAGDFNGDGKLDLAATCGHDVSVWLGAGSGHFSQANGSPYQVGPSSPSVAAVTNLAVGDFNKDGHPDLAALDNVNETLTILLNDGSAGFTATSASPIAVSGYGLALADFNGDGNLDLALNNHGNGELILGHGDGSFSIEYGGDTNPFPNASGSDNVAADLNGDGRPDLVGGLTDNDVRVLWNSPPDTWFTSLPPPADTRSRSASFAFFSDDAPVTYQCKLDGGQWSACTAPQSYSGLSGGSHTFAVRAVDTTGFVDPSPATRTWTVDLSTPPDAALTVPTSPALTGEAVKLDASLSKDPIDGGSIVDYRWNLGDGSFSQDTGSTPTLTHSFAAPGTYTVQVKVTNNVGETAIATGTVTVDLVPPSGNVGVSINDGDYATNDPHVHLDLVWPAYATEALISNDGSFGTTSGTETVPLSPSIPWSLRSEANEKLTKVVYLRFPDSPDPLLTFSDDIVVDTTAPVVQSATSIGTSAPATAPRMTTAARSKTYKVRIRATQKRSGISATQFSTTKHGGTVVWLRSLKVRGITKLTRLVRVTMAKKPRYVRVQSAAGTWSAWFRIR